MSGTKTRCGFAAIIGAPNAGKSTLVNALTGSKIAAVTHKAQTTRSPLRGIAIEGAAQIILVDTPGLFAPKRRLDRAMVDAAWQTARDADTVVLLVDAARRDAFDQHTDIVAKLAALQKPVLLALNKVDMVDKPRLLGIATAFQEPFAFAATFMISALSGDGVQDVLHDLAARMPPGPFLYPADQAADVPLRVLAAEITREKLTLRLHDELPYAATVETEVYRELKDGAVRIEQIIYVERDGQKAIVLGKGGATIKAIGQAAREELETLLARKVHLFLLVKVRERWSEEPERYERMGLNFPKG